MKFLKHTGTRVLMSLFAGGMVSELIFISTGDANRPGSGGSDFFLVIFAIPVYFILTLRVNKDKNCFKNPY